MSRLSDFTGNNWIKILKYIDHVAFLKYKLYFYKHRNLLVFFFTVQLKSALSVLYIQLSSILREKERKRRETQRRKYKLEFGLESSLY